MLSKARYTKQPFLIIINFFFVSMILCIALVYLRLPTQTYIFRVRESAFILDLMAIIFFIILFSSVYPLIEQQETVTKWYAFLIGLALGLGTWIVGLTFIPIGWLFFLLIWAIHRAVFRQLFVSAGFLSGFILLLAFFFSLPVTDLPLFWFFIMFIVGSILGVVLLTKIYSGFLDDGVSFLLLAGCTYSAHYFIVYLDFAFGIMALLGFMLFLIFFILDVDSKAKAILSFVFMFSCILIISLYHDYTSTLAFTIILILMFGQLIIAKQYLSATRAIFLKWISLTANINGHVNLSEHESMPDFKSRNISKRSYFFTYINYLILEPLKRLGYSIDVVEEQKDKWTSYIREIRISSSKR